MNTFQRLSLFCSFSYSHPQNAYFITATCELTAFILSVDFLLSHGFVRDLDVSYIQVFNLTQ